MKIASFPSVVSVLTALSTLSGVSRASNDQPQNVLKFKEWWSTVPEECNVGLHAEGFKITWTWGTPCYLDADQGTVAFSFSEGGLLLPHASFVIEYPTADGSEERHCTFVARGDTIPEGQHLLEAGLTKVGTMGWSRLNSLNSAAEPLGLRIACKPKSLSYMFTLPPSGEVLGKEFLFSLTGSSPGSGKEGFTAQLIDDHWCPLTEGTSTEGGSEAAKHIGVV